jgi:hypothetical protein
MLSMKSDVKVPTESNEQNNVNKLFVVDILKFTDEKSRIRIRTRNQVYGSKDSDPYHQNVTDPENCLQHYCTHNLSLFALDGTAPIFIDFSWLENHVIRKVI